MHNRKARVCANRLIESIEETPGLGEWRRMLLGTTESAVIGCPRCGTVTGLYDYHVAPDGAISPAFQCREYLCGFTLHIVLEGWAADRATEIYS